VQSKKPQSHDYYDSSVGSASLNISVFDNRQVSLLEVEGFKYVSFITATFKLPLSAEP
jgi:hypothetical protein